MNSTQAKMIEKYKALAAKSPKSVTVNAEVIEGTDVVSVMIQAEDPNNWRSGSNSAIFTIGKRGGIRSAYYMEDRIYSDSVRLEGQAAIDRIKLAEIYLFGTYGMAA